MPYKLDKIRLPKDKDRRRKLTDENKADIINKYKNGWKIRKIAGYYAYLCSRRLIQFIIYPERLNHNAKLFKERRKDGRYYNKEKNRLAIKNLRDYKRQLNLNALNLE